MVADPVVIVGAARTPIGGFLGELKDVRAPELGAVAIKAALERARLAAGDVKEVAMGCVLSAGLGQAPARQAALGAGLPDGVPSTTVNKMCGSGMKAAMLMHDAILAGSASVTVAGGIESMSNAPYILPKARSGLRMGPVEFLDHMYTDGLQDCFGNGGLMGQFAEDCARHYEFSRGAQDDYAVASLTRAQRALQDGTFDRETAPVTVTVSRTEAMVTRDELPRRARVEKIPELRPAFRADGTVTAANSSAISDGAAALVMMRLSEAERRGLRPLVRVIAHASQAQDPAWFTTAPIGSIRKVLEKAGWSAEDVDLFEINEAFAVVPMAAMFELGLPHEKVNVHGGACALGHPVGASGARIVVTLLNAMETYGVRRGVASLCIGGGEATAMAVERLD